MALGAWMIGLFAGLSCFFFWAGLLAIVPWLVSVVIPIVAAVRIYHGESFAYPLTAGLFNPT